MEFTYKVCLRWPQDEMDPCAPSQVPKNYTGYKVGGTVTVTIA